MRRRRVLALAAQGLAPSASAAAAGPITVIAIIDVVPDYAVPGNVAESGLLLEGLAEAARRAPGVENFQVLRDATRRFRQLFQPRQGGPFDERVYVGLK